jgi:hypothetical protein
MNSELTYQVIEICADGSRLVLASGLDHESAKAMRDNISFGGFTSVVIEEEITPLPEPTSGGRRSVELFPARVQPRDSNASSTK